MFQKIPCGPKRGGPSGVCLTQHSGAPFLGVLRASRRSLCSEEAHSLKKTGTGLIHQDDSYLGSLRLYSASPGLLRLVQGHGDLERENSLLNAGDRPTRLGTERAQCSHQDNFIRDAESNRRCFGLWCLEDPWMFPNPCWPAQGASPRIA